MLRWTIALCAFWGIWGSSEMEIETMDAFCEPNGNLNDAGCLVPEKERGLLQRKSRRILGEENEKLADDTTKVFQPLTKEQFETYISPNGVNFQDMQQGALGDCFLLAALVSIAKPRPDLIANMFTDAELLEGEHPVYTVKFRINGKETKVAVNEMVPASTRADFPYFANGANGARWPLIIEKAYAKAFGNYHNLDGGFSGDVFKAVTNAPVQGYRNWKLSAEQLFDIITEAAQKKWIMGTGTSKGCEIIVCGHEFTVLGAGKFNETFPQAVKLYNPWGKNEYKGKITGQDQSKGIFWATAEEFKKHFDNVDVAKVVPGAVLSPITLSVETQSVAALEFDMASNEPFQVQLEWPMWRFYRKQSENCEIDPTFTVLVAKKESPSKYTRMKKGNYYGYKAVSNAGATIESGSGKYVIYVNVNWRYSKSWLKDFVVNVYGPPTKVQLSSTDPADLVKAMGYQEEAELVEAMEFQESEDLEASAAKMENEGDLDDDMNRDESCRLTLSRLGKLNNGPEIARSGYDPLFPEHWTSLVKVKGMKGGDTADKNAKAVEMQKYDNWKSLRVLGEKPSNLCPVVTAEMLSQMNCSDFSCPMDLLNGKPLKGCEVCGTGEKMVTHNTEYYGMAITWAGCMATSSPTKNTTAVPDYCKPHGILDSNVHNDMPLCADGSITWHCNTQGRGGRVQCPAIAPQMCAKKACDGDQDYCCEKDCGSPEGPYGGPRAPCTYA